MSAAPTSIAVVDAASEEVVVTLPEATLREVDSAFDAARRAFPVWSGKSGAERAQVLRAVATGIKARYDELARLESLMGKILAESKWDIDDVMYCFEYYAKKAEELDAQQGAALTLPDADYTCHMRYEAMAAR